MLKHLKGNKKRKEGKGWEKVVVQERKRKDCGQSSGGPGFTMVLQILRKIVHPISWLTCLSPQPVFLSMQLLISLKQTMENTEHAQYPTNLP